MTSIKARLKQSKRLFSCVQSILVWMFAFGIDPIRCFQAFRRLPLVLRQYLSLRKQNANAPQAWPLRFSMPFLQERDGASGIASGHYFHQDLLVARRIFHRQPKTHVDVGSRIDGFVAHVATFRQLEVLDIRQQNACVKNIVFKQCDLMDLSDEFLNYCDSLSCLHALEHFGLGRYGDRIDVNGHVHGLNNMIEMLKPEGFLYLSVPIGRERIDFNGQRIFSKRTILRLVENKLDLMDFSYVDDNGALHESSSLDRRAIDESLELDYGCGIFEFRKRAITASNCRDRR